MLQYAVLDITMDLWPYLSFSAPRGQAPHKDQYLVIVILDVDPSTLRHSPSLH